MSKKTVEQRLEQMLADMERLVPELNRDGLYEEASLAQVIVGSMNNFIERAKIPAVASWPPKVTRDADGETHWRTAK